MSYEDQEVLTEPGYYFYNSEYPEAGSYGPFKTKAGCHNEAKRLYKSFDSNDVDINIWELK